MTPRANSLLKDLDDSPDAMYDFMDNELAGDGLPAVEPTPERVAAMVAASGRDPDEVVLVLKPRRGIATVETIAANAVMAGCRPEYIPVVIAGLESVAAGDPRASHLATTNSAAQFLVINGPARHTLNINFKESCFGVAGRANATIGRAVRLCLLNIAGSIPGRFSKSVFGHPGRYTMCIGEWDEMNPWAPLHVQRGYDAQQSCVTAFGSSSFINVTDIWSRSAESYLTTIAHTVNTVAGAWQIMREAEITIVLSPSWAEFIHRDGYSSLPKVQEFLWEQSKLPLSQFPPEHHDAFRDMGEILDGDIIALTRSPEKFNIIVAGGLGGLHTIAVHGMGGEISVPYPFFLSDQEQA
jgi:hypothetical protein